MIYYNGLLTAAPTRPTRPTSDPKPPRGAWGGASIQLESEVHIDEKREKKAAQRKLLKEGLDRQVKAGRLRHKAEQETELASDKERIRFMEKQNDRAKRGGYVEESCVTQHHITPGIYPLYTFIAVYSPICTHYTCIYTSNTPLNTLYTP